MIQTKATLSHKRDDGHGRLTLTFRLETALCFVPGQYVLIYFPWDQGTTKSRAYSIAGAPGGIKSGDMLKTDVLEIYLQTIPDGKGSQFFAQATVGTVVTIKGPAGFFRLSSQGRRHLFLAGGTGISPFLCFIRHGASMGFTGLIDVLWSSSYMPSREQLSMLQYLRQKSTQRFLLQNFTLCITRENILGETVVPPCISLHQGRVTKDLITRKLAANHDRLYLCGSGGFVKDITALCISCDPLIKTRISTERFS